MAHAALRVAFVSCVLGLVTSSVHAQGLAERGQWDGDESNTVCVSRTAAGPPGAGDRRVALSAAHALVRAFSVESAFATSDIALAHALDDDASLTKRGLPGALARYAGELADVCTLPAGPSRIGPAQVFTVGPVAIVQPGTGSIRLPPHARLLIVDLRHLPAVDGLDDILARMVAPAMRQPIAQPARLERVHDGPADEVVTAESVYATGLQFRQPAPLPASGPRDLPILLIVGQRIAPRAASFAATLRAARRAWIAGDGVPLEVAEAEWRGVGAHGLAVRTSMMIVKEPLPPEVLSDAVAAQDDPNDPTTAAYQRTLTVEPGLATLDIAVDAPEDADLDLYVLHDADGDSVFDWSTELVGVSATAASDERVSLPGAPPPGDYRIVVHGWAVPAGTAPFTLTIDRERGTPLPDVLSADFPARLFAPHHLSTLLDLVRGRMPPPISGPANRPLPARVNPFGFRHEIGQRRGQLRAGLIAAHGGVRMFYRYFPIVGDSIDGRLLETLAAADAHDGANRIAAWRILRRFGEALHDGHQSVSSFEPLYETALPVFLEHIDGRPVVRRSRVPGISPGDAIVALGSRPIEEVYAEELARTSAASPGHQLAIANGIVYRMNGPLALMLESPDGVRRTVTAAPQPLSDYLDVSGRRVSDRPSGPLTALGAPGLYYLNMNDFTTPEVAGVRAALTEAAALGSSGLVVDMRGYPGCCIYQSASRLIQQTFLSPLFEHALYNGPSHQTPSTSQLTLEPLTDPAFAGPLVLLTGPHAVSAAETFMQMLVGADRPVAVVGQRSAATNGNVTGLSLPGGFGFIYTGMNVRNPDGSVFHGTGIVPDIEVSPTAADLRDGIDRELLTAIEVLQPGLLRMTEAR
jgi:hypothetical protein